TGGSQRRSCPMPRMSPASRQSATAFSAPALVSASGFSQNTCLRAATAASICDTCSACGVASTTASTLGSRSASAYSPESATPFSPHSARTASTSGSTARTTRISAGAAWSTLSIFWPHQPMPTRAIPTGSRMFVPLPRQILQALRYMAPINFRSRLRGPTGSRCGETRPSHFLPNRDAIRLSAAPAIVVLSGGASLALDLFVAADDVKIIRPADAQNGKIFHFEHLTSGRAFVLPVIRRQYEVIEVSQPARDGCLIFASDALDERHRTGGRRGGRGDQVEVLQHLRDAERRRVIARGDCGALVLNERRADRTLGDDIHDGLCVQASPAPQRQRFRQQRRGRPDQG